MRVVESERCTRQNKWSNIRMVYGIETSSKARRTEWLSVEAYIYVCANDPPIFGFWIQHACSMHTRTHHLSVSTAFGFVFHAKIRVCYCFLLLLFTRHDHTLSLIVCLYSAFPPFVQFGIKKRRVLLISTARYTNKTKQNKNYAEQCQQDSKKMVATTSIKSHINHSICACTSASARVQVTITEQ